MNVNLLCDLTNHPITPAILPGMHFNAPVLIIQTRVGTVSLEASNDQLAEINYAIQRHLEAARYHETPDQQQILTHEHESEVTQ